MESQVFQTEVAQRGGSVPESAVVRHAFLECERARDQLPALFAFRKINFDNQLWQKAGRWSGAARPAPCSGNPLLGSSWKAWHARLMAQPWDAAGVRRPRT